MADKDWWFCLKHHTVEPRQGCKWSDRLGPYETYAQAERALERVAERNAEWDNDPFYNDVEEKDPGTQ